MGFFDDETGEVIAPIRKPEDIEKVIFSMLRGDLKPYEVNTMLLGGKMYFKQLRLELEDTLLRYFINEIDFSKDSKYWKTTFDGNKIRTKLKAENPAYKELSDRHDRVTLANSLIDMAEATVKMVNWTPWGQHSNKPVKKDEDS